MSTQANNIKRFMVTETNLSWNASSSEDWKAPMDAAVFSTSKFTSVNDWLASMEASRQSYANAGKTTEAWLLDCCGIHLSNEDTGAITGADAGGSTVKTASSIIYEPTGGATVSSPSSPSGYGVTVDWGSSYVQSIRNKFSSGYGTDYLSNNERILTYASNWWLTASLDLIDASYGLSFKTARGTQKLEVKVVSDLPSVTLGICYPSSVKYSGTSDKNVTSHTSTIELNGTVYDNITDREGSDADTSFKLDRTFAHELTHAVMGANIYTYSDSPKWFKEGAAELVHGIDDERKGSITRVAASASELDAALRDTSSVSDAEYAVGYVALRYFAQNANNDAWLDASGTVLKIASSNTLGTYNLDRNRSRFVSSLNHIDGENATAALRLEGDGGSNILLGGTAGDVVLGGFGVDTIRGGSGDDYLCGEYQADEILGGSGSDTVWGGTDFSNDVMAGGLGDDFLAGEGGDDFLAGEDGSDQMYGGVGRDVLYGGAGNDFLYGEHDGDALYGEDGNDYLWGGDGDDSLSGGTGEDWIYGGAGNDKLWGSSAGDDRAMDVFAFRVGEGQQVDEVMDFESGFDGIWCQDGSFTKAEFHGSDLWAYAGDDRGMIIHNAAGKEIKWANADGNINVFKA